MLFIHTWWNLHFKITLWEESENYLYLTNWHVYLTYFMQGKRISITQGRQHLPLRMHMLWEFKLHIRGSLTTGACRMEYNKLNNANFHYLTGSWIMYNLVCGRSFWKRQRLTCGVTTSPENWLAKQYVKSCDSESKRVINVIIAFSTGMPLWNFLTSQNLLSWQLSTLEDLWCFLFYFYPAAFASSYVKLYMHTSLYSSQWSAGKGILES